MKLKKALFTIAFLNITAALALSLLAIWGCAKLRSHFAAEGIGIVMDAQSGRFVINEMQSGSAGQEAMGEMISVVQIVLPIVIYICALFLSASMFYRLKLREPIAALTKGADRIIENDLDFEMKNGSRDELGQLCTAFETMRRTLLANNRELWRQAEERRRLNAAFAHDLRNPVTVLKGFVKLAKNIVEGAQGEQAAQKEQKAQEEQKAQQEQKRQTNQRERLVQHLQWIEDYTVRIERYVETMSGIQKLEEIAVQRERISWESLTSELETMLRLIGADSQKEIDFQASEVTEDLKAMRDSEATGNLKAMGELGEAGDSKATQGLETTGNIWVDRSIFLQIAENLTANAVRFAKHKITVQCIVTDKNLSLTVSDDGCGFPDSLLQKGIQPFQKGREDAAHFGMGLYICALLCEKHGGTLTIQNKPPMQEEETAQNNQTIQNGATARAVIKIQ